MICDEQDTVKRLYKFFGSLPYTLYDFIPFILVLLLHFGLGNFFRTIFEINTATCQTEWPRTAFEKSYGILLFAFLFD